MAKKPWFKVFNQSGDKKPTIYIYGIIGESWYSDISVTCNQFVNALDELAKDHDEIDVRINSPGGSVWDGMAIVNAIAQCKATVNTYIDGVAYSMGAIIALAGTKVYASKMSRFMLHTAMSSAYGHSKDMRKVADELDAFNQTIAQLVVDKTGMSLKDVLAKWFNYEDHYFSPDEMLSNKLIDEIIPVKAGAQNFTKMSFADAFDYFTKLEDQESEDDEEAGNGKEVHNNSIKSDMKFEKFNAWVNKVRSGEIPSAEETAAAQAEMQEAGHGIVLLSAKDNLVRNKNAQLIVDIKAVLPEGADPVAAINEIKQDLADVKACFEGSDAEGFNLINAVKKSVADAKAFAAQDGDQHNRQEHQDGGDKSKNSKQVLTNHYNKVAAELGVPLV